MVLCNVYANPKRSVTFTDLVIYTIFSINTSLIWTMLMLVKVREKCMYNTSDSSSFHGQRQ